MVNRAGSDRVVSWAQRENNKYAYGNGLLLFFCFFSSSCYWMLVGRLVDWLGYSRRRRRNVGSLIEEWEKKTWITLNLIHLKYYSTIRPSNIGVARPDRTGPLKYHLHIYFVSLRLDSTIDPGTGNDHLMTHINFRKNKSAGWVQRWRWKKSVSVANSILMEQCTTHCDLVVYIGYDP